ncbi:hypothetical protein [Niallia taxi]|uniref:hypothetical protein n=1 Tax=Niallia taxi TaxID=2499688 RepID=UPI0030080A2B
MKALVTQNCYYAFNDYYYLKGDIVDVTELESNKHDYVIYYDDGVMDYIPKSSVEILT